MLREKFNSGWQIEKVKSGEGMIAFYQKRETKKIHLPYDAMIHEERSRETPNGAQTGFYPGGEYIYQKSFFVPMAWKFQHKVLEFEGVYQLAMVFINGEFAARNVNGYSNFYIILDSLLRYGEENTIKVIADNSQEPNSRWYTGSGIYRNVNLLSAGRIFVPEDGIRITTKDANTEFAHIEIETKLHSISADRECVTIETFIEQNGTTVASDIQNITLFPREEELVRCQLLVENPFLWDCDHPYLYQCKVNVTNISGSLDTCIENFGIRTITVDPIRGFCINGKETKLRGSCIHHDNGVIGATTLEKAEEYRILKLKEAGFNSIRSAHHPISRAMLAACDKCGILVMDELTDVWTTGKNPHDYSWYFHEDWEKTIERMVDKDYNHPSVIMYSVGNEILGVGSDAGSRMNRKLCNKFHQLDNTRFTTNALNGLMAIGHYRKEVMEDIDTEFGSSTNHSHTNQAGSNALNNSISLMAGAKGDYFASHPLLTKALSGCSDSCDILGFNYLTGRHELERTIHPNKTVVGTETFPADIVRLWKIVKENKHVLGDFTWTGYDYLGEAGCGIFHYDGSANFSTIYPERTAYIGDIDLIGNRRPISYLREIVYGIRKEPYIAVERVDKAGLKSSKTPWMYKDNISSWTWHGLEGKETKVDVYSAAEEVELFLNGNSLGRKKAGESQEFTATYEVPYEKGVLRAVQYLKGVEAGEFSVKTADKQTNLQVDPDKTTLTADGEDLCFVMIKFVDQEGTENLWEQHEVSVEVEGAGILEGLGSANPSSEESYDSGFITTFDGYCLAVIRAGEKPGIIRVKVLSGGFEPRIIELEVSG